MNQIPGPDEGHLKSRPWLWRTALAGMLTLIVVGALAAGWRLSRLAEQAFEGEEGEEEKKTWSGRNFLAETVVIETPSESPTAHGFDSERVWSGYDDWEPAIAADPGSSYVYQLTTRYGASGECRQCPDPAMFFRRSHDGGATWGPDTYLPPIGKSQNDPQIVVAADGTIYAAWLQGYIPGIMFARSSDRGDTWSPPIAITRGGGKPNWSDKPILTISPDGRDVYIGFNASDSYVVYSHDSGQTFSAPVQTSDDGRYWFHSGGGVAPDGDVYFAATDFSQDYSGDSHIDVLKSTDGGVSWTTTRVDTSSEMPDCPWAEGCYFGFLGPSVALAVDTTGKITIAYHAGDSVGAPQKMYIRVSADGLTWSERKEVSNGSPTVNNAFPGLAAGPTPGDFRLVWQDDRNGSTDSWNTWYLRTANGGRTWSQALRLSDLGEGAPYKTEAGYFFPYGDYLEIAVDGNGKAHVIWGEGLSYIGPGGSWYTRGR